MSNKLLLQWMIILLVGAVLLSSCGISHQKVISSSERGLGGTGVLMANQSERGLGGTGIQLAERGLGGTGIVGTITAFGSVWVNGYHVHYDDQTNVLRNGQQASTEQLAIGQQVLIVAQRNSGRLVASDLEVIDQVIGTVQKISTENNHIQVAGQWIILDEISGTSASDFSTNQWLAVSGLRDEQEMIHATWIEQTHQQAVLIRGKAQLDTTQQLTIGEQVINMDASSSVEIVNGDNLLVVGQQIQKQNKIPFADSVERLSIEVRYQPDNTRAEKKYMSLFPVPALSLSTFPLPPLPQPKGEANLNRAENKSPTLFLDFEANKPGQFEMEQIRLPAANILDNRQVPKKELQASKVQRPDMKSAAPIKPERNQPQMERPRIERTQVERTQVERTQVERIRIERPTIERPAIHRPDPGLFRPPTKINKPGR